MPLDAFTDEDKEVAFRNWYASHAATQGLPPAPESVPGYDFRQAYLEGYEPDDTGQWDTRASSAFASAASTSRAARDKLPKRVALAAARTPGGKPSSTGDTHPPPISDATRADALARLDELTAKATDIQDAISTYTKGWVSPSELAAYRALPGDAFDYARRVAAHGRSFSQGVAIGDQLHSLVGMSFLPAFLQTFTSKMGEAGIGAARGGLQLALGAGAGGVGAVAANSPVIGELARRARDYFDENWAGLPTDPIVRAGYDSTFPWVARLLGDIGAFAATAAATNGTGELVGVPRMLSAARGARGLVAANVTGLIGGAIVGAALAPEDARARRAVEGAAVGLGAAAFVSTLLAGRPIGTPARLLRLQEMAATLGTDTALGAALKVAPRITFGRLATAALEGAGYTTLTSMGQGHPIDQAIGEGVDQGLQFAGYDTALIGLGRLARWLPIHARIAESWATTAEALKIPSRLARASGDVANTALQGIPGAVLGAVGGPVGAAIGGAITAAKAAKLQRELADMAARLRSTGAISDTIVNKLLTGSWSTMTAEEAEIVTKALTKDVVERAIVDADPVLRYAIRESMGSDAALALDNTELKALTYERGRVTQAVAMLRAQGILEVDPQMIQATRRLAELNERRSQVLLEEVDRLPRPETPFGPSTTTGVMGRVSEKEAAARIRDIVDATNLTIAQSAPPELVSQAIRQTAAATVRFAESTAAREEGAPAIARLLESSKLATGDTGRVVKGVTTTPTRMLFRDNPTILRDLTDASLESAGIDARLSNEGKRALDDILAAQRRAALPPPPIEAEIMPRATPPAPPPPRAPIGTYVIGTKAAPPLLEAPIATWRGFQKGIGTKPGFNIYNLNRDIPGHSAGSTVSETTLRDAGFTPPLPPEAGSTTTRALGTIASAALGAAVAPAIARRLGLLDEDDSALTASAVGFLAAAAIGYKLLGNEGIRITTEASRVTRFIRPTVEGELPAAEAARYVGRTGGAFSTTIGGSQVSGRRLYWLLPPDQQVAHTLATINAWPARTTLAGKALDMAARRKLFERDLFRFAPFAVTDATWQQITDAFMASTKALGYDPAQSMRLYKGWLGWMTTPLEQRGRIDISKMSLARLGADTTNPFTTVAGIDELRARAVTADVLTGPPQPLPRNYRAAANSLNKDGTPASGKIRELVDDIESNPPGANEGTADTLHPWWSAPGARGIAPTVRFYRYADRLIARGDPIGKSIHDVTSGIFQATELQRVADDESRKVVNAIANGLTPDDMPLLDRAVQDVTVRDGLKATNPRIYDAALAIRKRLDDRATVLGLQPGQMISDYLPWVYNYRTRRELAELRARGTVPTDVNYPIDAPTPRHVYFNHLEARGDTPLGARVSPIEALMMYEHGANRKIYMDQLLANISPTTFQRIRESQPWLAHDLGRWLLDVVGVPGPGVFDAQRRAERVGLWLESFPMFQRDGLAREINERYFLSPGGANQLSRVATGWAYTSKIGGNLLSTMTNLSQQILNGATEYGIVNILTSSAVGAGVAGGERIPWLAPVIDATVPRAATYRRLLAERGILSETSQRHFDTLALYEANYGTNRAPLMIRGAITGATTGAVVTSALNTDRDPGDQLSLVTGAATGASVATLGAAKSAIMRRALLRTGDLLTFPFNLVETWNRSTIGVAAIREGRATERALASPAYAATRRASEVVEGVFTGALGGAALANWTGALPVGTGALLGGVAAAGATPFAESRTARTARQLATIRQPGTPIFESRLLLDQAKVGLRKYTDEEVNTLYAQMQVDLTQFRIAKEGRGYMLNTPYGQALGALQSYTLSQAEFVGGRLGSFFDTASRAIRGEPVQIDFRALRYASYLMAVGSVYGSLLGGSEDGESDPDYWISRLGFGVMPFVTYNDHANHWQVNNVAEMFGGPLIGDITRVANTYITLLTNPTAHATLGDVSDKLTEQLFPGAKAIRQRADRELGNRALKLYQEGIQEAVTPQPQPMPAPRR